MPVCFIQKQVEQATNGQKISDHYEISGDREMETFLLRRPKMFRKIEGRGNQTLIQAIPFDERSEFKIVNVVPKNWTVQ